MVYIHPSNVSSPKGRADTQTKRKQENLPPSIDVNWIKLSILHAKGLFQAFVELKLFVAKGEKKKRWQGHGCVHVDLWHENVRLTTVIDLIVLSLPPLLQQRVVESGLLQSGNLREIGHICLSVRCIPSPVELP